jgi:hypothetical protein
VAVDRTKLRFDDGVDYFHFCFCENGLRIESGGRSECVYIEIERAQAADLIRFLSEGLEVIAWITLLLLVENAIDKKEINP